MGTLLKDLRYGLRMLAKTPAFTVVAVLSLALGIGANTTVFSLMDAVMLRSLPVQHPEQIVEVATLVPDNPPHYDFSYPLYAGLRDNNQSLSGLIAYSTANFGLAAGDRTERIRGEMVSANYFSVLGVQPAIGSAFAPSDETPGAPRAALISDALWTRFFNRDPAVLNKTISLNGRNFSVVGVAPQKVFRDVARHANRRLAHLASQRGLRSEPEADEQCQSELVESRRKIEAGCHDSAGPNSIDFAFTRCVAARRETGM